MKTRPLPLLIVLCFSAIAQQQMLANVDIVKMVQKALDIS